MIVDSVSEVLRSSADAIEAAARSHRAISTGSSIGVINLENQSRIVLLLNPDELLMPRRAWCARCVRAQSEGRFVIKILVVDNSGARAETFRPGSLRPNPISLCSLARNELEALDQLPKYSNQT